LCNVFQVLIEGQSSRGSCDGILVVLVYIAVMILAQSSRRLHEALQHVFDIYTEAMLRNSILWRERERRHIDLRLPYLSSPLASTGHEAIRKVI
jgi:hypothetical protein